MYPKLILKPGKEKSVLNRHPWIFSGAVKTLPAAEEGEIVALCDNAGILLGYGFFSGKSQITCRLFHFISANQVQNEVNFLADESFWFKKMQAAIELRKRYVIQPETNAYRLIHAEGDFWPGIIIDIYNQVAVLQLLIKGAEKIYPAVLAALSQLGFRHIYLKTKENSKILENMEFTSGWIKAQPEEEILILENGLKFKIDVEKGQKTGFFLDQRENRWLLQQYSAGKKILNAFSYTGGFSVYALQGKASEVHSVDISKSAVEAGETNIALNFGKTEAHLSVAADCFDYLRENIEAYDIIVLDPPAFAKNARSVPNASRGYKDLNRLAFQKVNQGGLVFTFSCSGNIDRELFRKIVFSAAAESGRNIRILHQLTQPPDHPVNIYHPEGEYLKGLVLYVE